MEEVPNDHEHLTLNNFSYEEHGFEYKYLREFEFSDEFMDPDGGQMQNKPTALDEQDLLSRLRGTQERNSPNIPQTIYAFYDNCKKHFFDEFISLLTGLMSNIEKTKRLREQNSEDRLLEFFNIKLDGPLNFGKHQTFVDSAAECDAETKAKLRACGKEIQLLVQAGREKATAAARVKLQACSEDFKTFGEQEWMRQCKKTSHHNILDQHFAVKCRRQTDEVSSDDDENGPNRDEFSRPRADEEESLELWKASTWLYQLAIHDSKTEIDKEIRRRRAQKLQAAETAATVRARQAEVNIRADAARPEVTLGDHFRMLDRRVAELDKGMSLMQANSHAQDSAPNTVDASQKTSDNNPAQLRSLQQKVMQLKRTVQTLQISAPHDTSKNDTGADSADTQQPAGKRRRKKRPRAEDTVASTANTTSQAAHTQLTMTTTQQHPQPPAPNHANGNGRNVNQQHRGGHQGSQGQARGPAQTHVSAPQQQDGRKQQVNVQSQTAPNRGGRGRGRGRGQGRGY